MFLPLDLGPLAWAWLALVALGASFVRGYSGFGFAALLDLGRGRLVTRPVALVPAVSLCDIGSRAAMGVRPWLHRLAAVAFLFGWLLSLGVPLEGQDRRCHARDTARIARRALRAFNVRNSASWSGAWRVRAGDPVTARRASYVGPCQWGGGVAAPCRSGPFCGPAHPPATFRATLVATSPSSTSTPGRAGVGGLVHPRHASARRPGPARDAGGPPSRLPPFPEGAARGVPPLRHLDAHGARSAWTAARAL
jgi:hypothetical protein